MEFNNDDLLFFSSFFNITKVNAQDMIRDKGYIIFIVNPFEMGKAIGKNASNIKKLTSKYKHKVIILPKTEDPEMFIRAFFNNVKILSVDLREAMGQKGLFVTIDERDRGIAIGKNGNRIKVAKNILKTRYGCDLYLKTKRVLDIQDRKV